jgi:hypothetical protein
MSQKKLEDGEKARVKRCLIEDSLTQAVSGRDTLSPLIVGPRISRQVIEKRDRLDLKQIDEANGESEDDRGGEEAAIAP